MALTENPVLILLSTGNYTPPAFVMIRTFKDGIDIGF